MCTTTLPVITVKPKMHSSFRNELDSWRQSESSHAQWKIHLQEIPAEQSMFFNPGDTLQVELKANTICWKWCISEDGSWNFAEGEQVVSTQIWPISTIIDNQHELIGVFKQVLLERGVVYDPSECKQVAHPTKNERVD